MTPNLRSSGLSGMRLDFAMACLVASCGYCRQRFESWRSRRMAQLGSEASAHRANFRPLAAE